MVFLGAVLRDHRPARRAQRAGRPAQPARGAARPAVPGPVRRPLRGRRPRRRHLRRGRGRGRGGRRRARGVGLQPRAHRRHRPALPAQAGADVAAPGGRPRWRCRCRSWPSGRSTSSPTAMRSYFRDVLDHAIRVRDQVGGARRAALLDPAGVAGADVAGRQRGHAQDLGVRRHHRRPHRDRRDLRDELRVHAGAGVALRLSAGAAGHRDRPACCSTAASSATAGSSAPRRPPVCADPPHRQPDAVDQRTVTPRGRPRSGRSAPAGGAGRRRSRRPPSSRPPAAG